MDLGNTNHARLIGDYILGPRIGWGSFAVVWRSRHRQSGVEVAIKEIDKRQLSSKVSENLLKEISILSTIKHPNIVSLFEVIESKDRIYLVLEYCDGGDLAAYLNRHGKVSEAVARHFMRQLAAGLQVLQAKHLIHRDLKPQNLLLMTNEETPPMKIGDFGFARPLTPECLADTLCGSPLYMAPEIIQNQKYDARADLWSVGAILFQLVTGRPPFNGSNQIQLFHNILSSTELQFPDGALEELHPDCVDLCQCLLCQNPDERLTFKEFFRHNFLGEPGSIRNAEQSSSPTPSMKSMTPHFSSYGYSKRPLLLPSGIPLMNQSSKSGNLKLSPIHDDIQMEKKDSEGTSVGTSDHGNVGTACGVLINSVGREPYSSVVDSLESIEKDYVLVNARSTTVEAFSYYPLASLQVDSTTRSSSTSALKQKEPDAQSMQMKQLACDMKRSIKLGSDLLPTSCTSTILTETHGISVSNPSIRLQNLYHYVQVLAALSQEKHNAGLFTEAFSLELVVLAIWRKILHICSTWMVSSAESELPGNSSTDESDVDKGGAGLPLSPEENIDFRNPSSVSTRAEQAFIVAFNRAEKLSDHIKNMDDAAEMPDAMELIFQKALAVGTSGAVDEYMDNKEKAFASYSRALLVLSFIAEEATSLSLKPPFSLTPSNKKRIQQYIMTLHSRQADLLKANPPSL